MTVTLTKSELKALMAQVAEKTLAEAKKGGTPKGGKAKAKKKNEKKAALEGPAGKCQAMKRDGDQCTRSAMDDSRYCWKHDDMVANGEVLGPKEKALPKARCTGTTKKGKQCKKPAEEGYTTCWMHGDDE